MSRTLLRFWYAALVVCTLSFPPLASAQERTTAACNISPVPANCKGMWALVVEQPVPHGAYVHVPDPGCMNETTDEVAKLLQTAMNSALPQLAFFSGPISKLVATPINEAFKSQGGDIGRLFSPYAKNGALCVPVVAVVPAAAEVIGFRLEAAEAASTTFQVCTAGADCPIGWSKFQRTPQADGNPKMQAVTVIYMNWSHNLDRKARMTVFYKLPKGHRKPLSSL
ncbi:MAG: hypothetical protein JSS56_04750 [Proteobacteria bacterium]|nr:hypothetical protein [Pseudomonadota bacterium]